MSFGSISPSPLRACGTFPARRRSVRLSSSHNAADLAPGMPTYDNEVFGPVAPISRAKDDDDAMRLCVGLPLAPTASFRCARPLLTACSNRPSLPPRLPAPFSHSLGGSNQISDRSKNEFRTFADPRTNAVANVQVSPQQLISLQ